MKIGLEKDPQFVKEYLRAKFVADVFSVMRERHLDKDKMADLLHRSRSFVDAILHEEIVITVEIIAMFACALDMDVKISLSEKE